MDEGIEAAGARREGSSGASLLLLGGAITTGLALTGVFFLNQAGENIMGWYANYVIPAGALIVGLVASSGFAVSSWHTGTKIGGRLLVGVMLILLAAYFVAQYLEFQRLVPVGAVNDDGAPVGFWSYFDLVTQNFRWAPEDVDDSEGSPFGLWGYAMRGLEISGFVLGGLLAPLGLRGKPYCETCSRYMRTKAVALVPAAVKVKRIFKNKEEQRAESERQSEAAFEEGQQKINAIFTAAEQEDAIALQRALEPDPTMSKRQISKLATRFKIDLVHCPICAGGHLSSAVLTGQGNHTRIVAVEERALNSSIVATLAGRSKLPRATARIDAD